MASNVLNRAVHRPVRTCTQCKQVKLRCDSKEKFPAPCTRCTTRNLQCIVDSSFRRTPARKRVEEMAKELEALRSQKTEDGNKSFTESPSLPESMLDSPDHPAEQPGMATVDETGLDQDYFQLEDFVIDRDTVVGVFSMCAADSSIFSSHPVR
ncbi:hypothetical protein BDW02DRAFT_564352 [Decorospora gaudefroyi]|uniref:Zn(2)-C6 fungal-type domain-containing protein n=1 Tax=Decorospora gaudefroyi TaxID=184978 RepID=A0A6A5KYV1_9PLEO|nr:hypothetical protein BDW02DRAFT_564352 [Decorospora gaudefroyi]